MKIKPFCLLLLACFPHQLIGALYIGPATGSWNNGEYWDTGEVPAPGAGESVEISSGATVDYPAGTLGDLIVGQDSVVKIAAGSTWRTQTTHWTQVNGGMLLLDSGNFVRETTGNFVLGFSAGSEDYPLVSSVMLKNGAVLSMTTPGTTNFFLSFSNNTSSSLDLKDSALILGGEIWMGRDLYTDFNETADINLNNSSITAGGPVGLWIWDYAGRGNKFRINFTGAAGSYFEVADSIGIQDNGTRNNATTWESLWELGILTAYGQSGTTAAAFSDYFVTEGSSERDAMPYRLILIPEPSMATLLSGSLVAGMLARRRR